MSMYPIIEAKPKYQNSKIPRGSAVLHVSPHFKQVKKPAIAGNITFSYSNQLHDDGYAVIQRNQITHECGGTGSASIYVLPGWISM
jgi:hypothetical protein